MRRSLGRDKELYKYFERLVSHKGGRGTELLITVVIG